MSHRPRECPQEEWECWPLEDDADDGSSSVGEESADEWASQGDEHTPGSTSSTGTPRSVDWDGAEYMLDVWDRGFAPLKEIRSIKFAYQRMTTAPGISNTC
jgi:hypothetical protein